MNDTVAQILVVDDETQIRALLCDLLESHGFEVLEAANGAQMREHLAQASVDLLIWDRCNRRQKN